MKTKGFITISVSAMLLTVMLLIGTAAPVKAEETETDPTSGDCGENVQWTLENGVLTISGTGRMCNYANTGEAAWYSQNSSIKTVVIEDGVTSVGDFAFYYIPNLTSVTIPNSVTSIGQYAFANCGMAELVIPDSVTSIGKGAFTYCRSLTRITLSKSIKAIADGTFSSCGSLSGITIPNSVTTIGFNAFGFCYSLSEITIPESVKTIENSAFQGCNGLRSVTIPESVTSLGDGVFSICSSLVSIAIPDTVKTIGEGLFRECTSLSAVKIPLGMISIGEETFIGCTSLTSITIPEHITSIGRLAFAGCTSLTSITLPNSVTSIDYRAFYRCTNLKDLTICNSSAKPGIDMCGQCPSVVIHGWAGSAVETYANENEILFDPFTAKVTFVDEKGNTLQSELVPLGTSPSYSGEIPVKDPDAQYTYSFGGWNDGTTTYDPEKALPALSGEATYRVTYTATVNQYTIKFVNEDGSELQSSKVPYGETPSYTGQTPTKEKTAQYTYTFAGWKDATETVYTDALPPVSKEATYKADYSATVNEYTVKFVNEDGSELQSSEVPYGETPSYTGQTPTKEKTAQYTYTFAGWKDEAEAVYTDELPPVIGEATYKADYSATVNKYTVKFVNEDGSELQSDTLAYGETPEYKGETPIKKEDEKYTYTFEKWSPEIAAVTGDAAYTAVYTATEKPVYTVTDGGDSELTLDAVTDLVITVKRSPDDTECFAHFSGVLLDGDALTEEDYDAKAGSTVVTIKAATLKQLSAGSHTITVSFDDGETETKVTIQSTPEPAPEMGDSSRTGLWVGFLILSVLSLGGLGICEKKSRYSAD